MATYTQIEKYIKEKNLFVPKPCWIAHVKSHYGLTTRTAPNRISPAARRYPCPPNKWPAIEAAFRHFGMI